MTISKLIRNVFIIMMVFAGNANATIPKVSQTSFSEGRTLISVRAGDSDYYAILAKRSTAIEETQLKKEKILALKSKQILFKHMQSQYDDEIALDMTHATPVLFWESAEFSYLIMVIDKTAVTVSIIADELLPANDAVEKYRSDNIESEPASEDAVVEPEKIDTPVVLTFNEAKRLYTEAIRAGDRLSAKKYLNIMKGK